MSYGIFGLGIYPVVPSDNPAASFTDGPVTGYLYFGYGNNQPTYRTVNFTIIGKGSWIVVKTTSYSSGPFRQVSAQGVGNGTGYVLNFCFNSNGTGSSGDTAALYYNPDPNAAPWVYESYNFYGWKVVATR